MKTKFILTTYHMDIVNFDEFMNNISNKKEISINGFLNFYKRLSFDERKKVMEKLYNESFLKKTEIEKISQKEIADRLIDGLVFKYKVLNFTKKELIEIFKNFDNSFVFYNKYLLRCLEYIIFYLICEKKVNPFDDIEKFLLKLSIDNSIEFHKKFLKNFYEADIYEKYINIPKEEIIKNKYKNDNVFSKIHSMYEYFYIDNLCRKNNIELTPLSVDDVITEIFISCISNDSEGRLIQIND